MLTKSVAYLSFHECWLYHNYESANTCTTPAAASLTSAVDVDDLQAWRMVHISVVSRNCSVLARIRGPYSKTNFLHCQDIRINKNYLFSYLLENDFKNIYPQNSSYLQFIEIFILRSRCAIFHPISLIVLTFFANLSTELHAFKSTSIISS